MGALAVCSALCRNSADDGRLGVLPPRSWKLAARLGPPADDFRLHGAIGGSAFGASRRAHRPDRLRASAPAGRQQRGILVLDRAPRGGRSAPLLARAVRIALRRVATGAPPSREGFKYRIH